MFSWGFAAGASLGFGGVRFGGIVVLNRYGAEGWRFIPLNWGDFICFERG